MKKLTKEEIELGKKVLAYLNKLSERERKRKKMDNNK